MSPRPRSATIQLKVRMKEPLRAKIEACAKTAGVSLNAELVSRLEKSFTEEANLHWAVSHIIGDDYVFRAFLAALMSLRVEESHWKKTWVEEPYIRQDFAKTFKTFLDHEAERAAKAPKKGKAPKTKAPKTKGGA